MCGRHDLYLLDLTDNQQVFIATDEIVGLTEERVGNQIVVLRVAGDVGYRLNNARYQLGNRNQCRIEFIRFTRSY